MVCWYVNVKWLSIPTCFARLKLIMTHFTTMSSDKNIRISFWCQLLCRLKALVHITPHSRCSPGVSVACETGDSLLWFGCMEALWEFTVSISICGILLMERDSKSAKLWQIQCKKNILFLFIWTDVAQNVKGVPWVWLRINWYFWPNPANRLIHKHKLRSIN